MNCPICTRSNACAQTCGSGRSTCWCFSVAVSQPILDCLKQSDIAGSCLCRGCLTDLVAAGKILAPVDALAAVIASNSPTETTIS